MSAADDDAQLASAQRFLDHLHANGRQSPSDIDCRFEMALPAWYDHRKFQRGQQLCAQNTYALFMSTIVGGLSLLALPSIRAVLRSTGQSDTAQLNYRRYQKTMLYAMLWTREPLEPGSRSWRSLESVRKRHVLVSRRTAAAAHGEGMRITQTDMSLVLYAIVGYALHTPALYGFDGTPANVDAVAHLWRVLGHLLGVRDEFNLFTDDPHQNAARLRLVQQQIYGRAVAESASDPDFLGIARAMAGGMSGFQPLLTPGTFLYFVRAANGCEGYTNYWALASSDRSLAALSWWDRVLLAQLMFVHTVLVRWRWARTVLNVWMAGLFGLTQCAPVLAWWHYGWRGNFVRVKY